MQKPYFTWFFIFLFIHAYHNNNYNINISRYAIVYFPNNFQPIIDHGFIVGKFLLSLANAISESIRDALAVKRLPDGTRGIEIWG